MKKYVSPLASIQALQITSNAAGACGVEATLDVNSCPVTVDGFPFTLFTEYTCEAFGTGYEDMICYHVPMAGANVFSS